MGKFLFEIIKYIPIFFKMNRIRGPEKNLTRGSIILSLDLMPEIGFSFNISY